MPSHPVDGAEQLLRQCPIENRDPLAGRRVDSCKGPTAQHGYAHDAKIGIIDTIEPDRGSRGLRCLFAATKIAQAHGYNGLNFRDLAEDVGIEAASIYYHFPSKADLAAAVVKRYWENAAAALETLLAGSSDPLNALRRYPEAFRWALENENRMCLSGLMAAEYDDLPEAVKKEV